MYHELSAWLLPSLDMAGTAVFAISGALAAARARQTPLTFAFFAVVTGIGGNTLSELLMGAPVVWVHHPTNIVVCLLVALLAWITPLAWWPNRAIDWFDALGIAAYGAVGAAKALNYSLPRRRFPRHPRRRTFDHTSARALCDGSRACGGPVCGACRSWDGARHCRGGRVCDGLWTARVGDSQEDFAACIPKIKISVRRR
jgi:Glycine transporter